MSDSDRKFRIVFEIFEDVTVDGVPHAAPIGDKKAQIAMLYQESALLRADVEDAGKLDEIRHLTNSDPVVMRVAAHTHGRGRVVREISKATGFTIGKHLEEMLRPLLCPDPPPAAAKDEKAA